MRDKSPDLIVSFNPLRDAGKGIANEAATFHTRFLKDWTDFMNDYKSKDLPNSLYFDFENYDTQHKGEIETVLHNREQIGNALSSAADLHAFQEKIVTESFNIYTGNYYSSSQDSQIEIDHLYPPKGFDK